MNNLDQYVIDLLERAKKFGLMDEDDVTPMINCSYCLDQGFIFDMVTDGERVLCRPCAADVDREFTVMRVEYLCEICQALVKPLKSAADWDGRSQRSLICDGCVVQYSRERARPSADELRDIIGDT